MQIGSDSVIAVIGAGTMGAGIAQVAAAAGHAVVVIDTQAAGLERGRAGVASSLAGLVRRGALDEAGRATIERRIRWSGEIADAAGAALAIEAIVERMDAKLGLLAALARIVGATAILASNTSSLSINAMAQALPEARRFIGLHFFNPVPVMKLVEVVPGDATDPAVTEAAIALMRGWGKRPVRVRDVPGFIVNRVARPYYAEGFLAWGQGIEPAAIDHALVSAGGFRMGPLALADMIGHDVNYAVASSVYESYGGKTRFRPQANQRALVEDGRLGRKSGGGVYAYGADLPKPSFAANGPAPEDIRVAAEGGTSARLFRDAGLPVREDDALPDGIVAVNGVRLAVSDGRPLAVRDDIDVLVDAARDFEVAGTIVMTARDPAAAAAAAGLVQATGRAALLIPDRPGMLVLRTLAQLANAAADAVADDVADAAAIDEALVHGANHPQGPLHWAERAGRRRVADVLANIADATGDTMYLPSASLGGGAIRNEERRHG